MTGSCHLDRASDVEIDVECFKNEKKSFNMLFAYILNGFGPKMNK